MMASVALVCVVVWLLGTVSSYTIGGLIHVFLVVGIGMMLPRIILGRKTI